MAKKKVESVSDVEGENSAIDALFSKFKKTGRIVDLSKSNPDIPRISTGIMGLDFVLGGGWPLNRVIEVYGKFAVGKTTLVCETIKTFQQHFSKPVLLFDSENKINLAYAQQLGVDLKKLERSFSQTTSIEEVGEIAEAYMDAGVSAVIIDSIGALESEAELKDFVDNAKEKGGLAANDHGSKAKKIGQLVSMLARKANETNTLVMMTNQIRIAQQYGTEYTPGGEKRNHGVAIKLKMERIGGKDGTIYSGEKEVGHKLKVYGEKNQCGVPHRLQEIDLLWGIGFDPYTSLFKMATFLGVIRVSGAWYYYKDEKWQGQQSAMDQLSSDLDLYNQLYQETMQKMKETM